MGLWLHVLKTERERDAKMRSVYRIEDLCDWASTWLRFYGTEHLCE